MRLLNPNHQLLILASLSVCSLLAATPDRVRKAVEAGATKTVSGSVHRLAQAQYDQGSVDPAMPMRDLKLVIKLSAEQQADLDQLLQDQQNPSSPNYQTWLTPEDYAARFGLSASDESKIAAWLASEGLQVDHSARGRNWIGFSGTAGQVEHALGAPVHQFRVDGSTRFAATAVPSVPEALSDVIGGFIGLDDFTLQPITRTATPVPNFNSGGLHFLAPADFATIYNLNPLYAGGFDGTGQSIVVVGQSALSLTDIRAFRTRHGLPANDPKIGLYGGTDPGFTSSQVEGTLDVEWAGAIAPKATINYVYGTNAFSALIFAVEQNISPIITVSYGNCETDFSNPVFRAVGQQANAQGITIFVASGDSGAAACNLNGDGPLATQGMGASFPAALPEVTAVGGTQFVEGNGNYWAPTNSPTFGSALSYIPEAAWNESNIANRLASTGGGKSAIFPRPTWQTGAAVPADGGRLVPDISLTAALHDPYLIVYGGFLTSVAGTSASSPAMAGIAAILNQYQIAKGFSKATGLGNINPQLYRLAKSSPAMFHDIVNGDNIVPCVQGSPDCTTGSFGYRAGPGYDMATGLGSIDANLFVTGWNSATNGVNVTLLADPGSRTLNDSVALTARVLPASGTGTPTGNVAFVITNNSFNPVSLGSAPLVDGRATMTVPLYLAQLTGIATLSAQYSGDAAFSSGGATLRVTVTNPASGVAVVIPSQPVNVWPEQEAGKPVWNTTLSLREAAGVPAMLTGFTIDGVAQEISKYFPSPNIPPSGSVTASFRFRDLPAPVTKVFGYTGIDAGGLTWSRQISVLFNAKATEDYFTLSATPLVITQNPAAPAGCQWSTQLNVDDQGGFSGGLLSFLYTGNGYFSPGANSTGLIPSIFGTTRMDPYTGLQGTICFDGASAGKSDQVFLYASSGLFQEVTVSFAPAPSKVSTIAVSPSKLSMAVDVANLAKSTTAKLAINLSDPNQQWTASVFPANRTTTWLSASQLTGTGSGEILLTANGKGFAPGVYRATVTIQTPNAVPQVTSIPVMFVLGSSVTGTEIKGVTLYGSTSGVGSPGTLFSAFGTKLATTTNFPSVTPLEYKLDGVTAAVNGIAAPVLYVKPDVVGIQIPYEVGAGPAVLGINNNGEIAGYQFEIAPAAPAILTEPDGALFRKPAVKRGSYTTFYATGMGDVTPALLTGFSPTTTVISSLPRPVLPPQVTIGGVQTFVQFAGVGRGMIGMQQINILLPANVPSGNQPLVITLNGVSSAPVMVNVQ